jgi:hypothetical protein
MISIQFDDKTFLKDFLNITGYSEGFLEGVHKGKSAFLKNIAKNSIEVFKNFVDQNARVDQQMYHHIYEWYQVGNPNARLFDIEYEVSNTGISFNGTFSQSASLANGSTIPFYDKAHIMEKGIPITIRPKNATVLSFNIGEEQIFTSKPVLVEHPGGTHVAGSFEHIFNLFFTQHFTQSVLELTGIRAYLETNKDFKYGLALAKTGGKARGEEVGYNWIMKAGELSV